jgi:hypothetical protein
MFADVTKLISAAFQISEDGKKIRRAPAKPLPAFSKEQQENMKLRSIYAVCFCSSFEFLTFDRGFYESC